MARSQWVQDQQGNFSNEKNDTFLVSKHYTGIRLQQGVPVLDRDWNELEDIIRFREWRICRWYIGDGVPGNIGFRIEALDQPADNFKINRGACMVKGFEAWNWPVQPEGDPVQYDLNYLLYKPQGGVNILAQEDVDPLPAPPESGTREDIVYIDVWIKEVTAEDDPDLANSQDIGIETCIRHKLEWRVRVAEGGNLPSENRHRYYSIAKIKRFAGKVVIEDPDIEDLRRINFSLAYLRDRAEMEDIITSDKIKEADGTTGQDTSTGSGIKTSHIQDDAITTAKLANEAVTTEKIINQAVTSNKIGNGAVINEKLANNAVSTEKIQNEAVSFNKLNIATILNGTYTVSANDTLLLTIDTSQINADPLPPAFYLIDVLCLTQGASVEYNQRTDCAYIGGDYGPDYFYAHRLAIKNIVSKVVQVRVTVKKFL